jgi:DNA-binding transcriptional LysR family regulator
MCGRVDIASMPSPGIEPLASIISQFMTTYPGLSIRVDGSFTAEEVVTAVLNGTAEFGLLGEARRRPIVGLDVVELGEQSLVLISPASAVFRSSVVVELDELSSLPFIASPPGSVMREVVDDVMTRSAEARVVVEVAHRTTMLALARRGVGHAVMPSAWATLVGPGLQHRRIEPRRVLRTALVHRREGLTPASLAFLNTVRLATPAGSEFLPPEFDATRTH